MSHFFTIALALATGVIAAYFVLTTLKSPRDLWRYGVAMVFVVLAVAFVYGEVQNIKAEGASDLGKSIIGSIAQTPTTPAVTAPTVPPLSGDSDGDGIPDSIDDYPYDSTQW